MNQPSTLNLPFGRAICYSGYRDGQRPGGVYPSYEEVREDLLLLQGHWEFLRLYNVDQHSETILEVIKKEKLDFKILLGAYIEAEINNPNNPWGAGVYPDEKLAFFRQKNTIKIRRLASLAKQYPDIVFSISVGNEACVDWTDHMVPVDHVIEYAEMAKDLAGLPVTFCENYVPWYDKLKPLGEVLDFISIHTYPVWEYKGIEEALDFTKENYYSVAKVYPDKPVVITEAGWPTKSNGRGFDPNNANEDYQKIYYEQLMEWTDKEGILTFYFEAFDEPWKGSGEPLEPEKHWGLFFVDRTPKKAMEQLFAPVKD